MKHLQMNLQALIIVVKMFLEIKWQLWMM
uniref:Uncharacterized protein n=1 Tax=Anguilla anguilla TaxID=7936 RepID=A0A0E9RW66_ANGAN